MSATRTQVYLTAAQRARIDEVVDRGPDPRRETGIRLPDAPIAATALESGLGLVTRNARDFSRVRQLRVRRLG